MQTSSFIALILLDDAEIVTPASWWSYFKLADIRANNTNQTQRIVVGYTKAPEQILSQELQEYRGKFLPLNAGVLNLYTAHGYPFKRVVFDLHSFYMDDGVQE